MRTALIVFVVLAIIMVGFFVITEIMYGGGETEAMKTILDRKIMTAFVSSVN